MATLVNFKRRTLTSDADLEAIAHLYNLCISFDHLDGFTSVTELQEELSEPDFDREQDLQLWGDRHDNLCASAMLWRSDATDHREGYLHFSIHPEARSQGLEADILAWAEQRMRQTAQGSPLPVELHLGCRDTFRDRIALYEQWGCLPIRYFFRMRRSLTDPIPTPQLPEGFQVRQVDAKADATAWVDLYNQSFIDHWNHHPMTLDRYHHYTSSAEYNPSLDWVAIAPDGTLAAFCGGHIHTHENAQTGRQEGWVRVLGTRRGFRRQGLGRAMLLAGLHHLAEAGMETALLGVDANNPSGALGLYQSVGFESFRRFIIFRKPLG